MKKESFWSALSHRRSVRTYLNEPIGSEELSVIREAIVQATNVPLPGRYEIRVVENVSDSAIRPSTYGVIKGALAYLLLFTAADRDSRMAGGYALELVVIAASRIGLGTCWVGGTFSAKSFCTVAPKGMTLSIVCPMGYAAPKTRLIEKLMTRMAGSSSRKPFEKLFKLGNAATLLRKEVALALEAVRVAPSSVNSQPWRAIQESDRVEFYSVGHSVLNDFDLGIALCHFISALDELGVAAKVVEAGAEAEHPAGWQYVATAYFNRTCECP